ncbi:DUF397 domain-containing protein [Actinokineospora sp. NBRC 105648]|uniref:DUF397 domain-containing protein n=1 Tax=Actinokineospora sp. NBRC 105648 TaxID=3032206 RepID=UPI0024A16470|nr:DUF397 domain-containing protein [Actinokineospora sp. NBRC 105648]GLZ41998.1 hypothetical protein Acsp05_56220 [Actinokineospora sp. NBRC 105648]
MTNDSHPDPKWRKSSYSTGTGNCVEVAPLDNGAMVRDSKYPAAGPITVPPTAWTAFVTGAANGEFDHAG